MSVDHKKVPASPQYAIKKGMGGLLALKPKPPQKILEGNVKISTDWQKKQDS